ncbi:MAG: endonuclease [Saprospiraceae bacterium]|nr:endonuclease [Saprospiraceae bacterium]
MKQTYLSLFTALLLFFFTSISRMNAQTIIYAQDFGTNTSGDWTTVDVASPTDIWRFTSGYAQINGFGDEDDQDWLISPAINMNIATNETFAFKSKNRYAGATTGAAPNTNLELKYTTNYTGDPSTTTWVTLTLPASVATSNNTTSTLSASASHSGIDISAIAGTNVRFGFRYYGTAAASKDWQIDDIQIAGVVPCVTPTTQATALVTSPLATSANISWTKGDGSNTLVIVNTQNAFTTPVNGTTYTANTVYSSGEQIVYTGIGSNVSVTGLTNGTTYFVRVYNFNPCTTPITYVTTAPLSGSFTTSTNTVTCGTAPTAAQINTYYAAVGTLTCAPMLNALRTIITTNHTGRTYTQLWTDYQCSDKRSDGKVWDMYSDVPNGTPPYLFTFGTDQDNGTLGTIEGQKYNREHTMPKSWYGGSTTLVSATMPIPGTDLFNVYPTDKKVNGVRGNQPYGETNAPSFTSLNGCKYGISSISGIAGEVFEPINAYKGDFARNYFYMATRYNISNFATTTAEAGIALSDSFYTGFHSAYLAMLYRWHLADPVSQKEIDRNNAVYAIQGNRNPYIDRPEWVARVFVSNCGTKVSNEERYTIPLSIFPNPATNSLRFELTSMTSQAIEYRITDVLGQVRIQKNITGVKGSIEDEVATSELPNGVYFFQIQQGVYQSIKRFVKQ